MKYRDHRGGLEDSMKTVIEVDSLDRIANHLSVPVGHIKVERYGQDHRNGWFDTHIVLVNGCAVGFTNGPI